MSTPTASIIVPSYKGELKLQTLLPALLSQTTDNFEVIVVLDGIFDKSEKLIETHKSLGLNIRAVIFPDNRGRVSALNAGFNAARGDVLIRCDDDLEPCSNYVSAHIARHQFETVGVIGLYDDILPQNRYAQVYGYPRNKDFRRQAYLMGEQTWHLWAGNCSIRRETWERVGEYSPAYTHYGWEDVDYGYRLYKHNIPVILAPELETIHHGAAISVSSRTIRAFHSAAAKNTFASEHPSVLDPPEFPHDTWGKILRVVGSLETEENYLKASEYVDKILPFLHPAIGKKLVASLIESAAVKGYYSSSPLKSRF
ncbi:glycosyltransferase family 2 protein [Actinomyces vulturis]|uniref:glycosyltransferase family 2 protein n=1 Tax=Actinomyces vulturis TaxID=1857645 RepID=UPI00083784BF|nr:glycosyltransferase family 2 protein [Actinomyces vulturis]